MANPLLQPSTLPFQLPDFAAIDVPELEAALDDGMSRQREEVRAITDTDAPATFENTVLALETSGDVLRRTANVFFALISSDATEGLRELEADVVPRLSAHEDAITLDPVLYRRIAEVYADRDQLEDEDRNLTERYYTEFRLAGAELTPEDQDRLRELNRDIAAAQAEFRARLQADTNDSAVLFETAEELDGLSDAELSACARAASDRGLDGYLVTLVLPTTQPYLASLTNRESRRRLFEASVARGSRGNEHDTTQTVQRILRLRAERAKLLGYPHHAAYAVADASAGTVEAIEDRIYPMAAPAARNAEREKQLLQQLADREQQEAGAEPFEIAAWDWAYYSDKVRAERYAVDASALRPYFEYDRVLRDGVFFAANAVYGMTFEERTDLRGYSPDVRVFEVKDKDGSSLGLFLHDVYTRDAKRGGAWMNNFVDQSGYDQTLPVVCNNLNVPKPADGEPTLLTLDEVRTMFHEFGHAIHGLLSDCRYGHVSGTSVPRDFVEFPSQVNEMWIEWPEVIANYAVHHETGEPLDPAVVERLRESAQWGEGYETSAYLAAALLDQELHKTTDPIDDLAQFQAEALNRIGLDNPAVPPRYGTAYFNHAFGGGYDARYYSYIWSEVLDADTVAWFTENGGLRRENGDRFRDELLSRGRSRDPMESYRQFRGRDPKVEPLLERRGLI